MAHYTSICLDRKYYDCVEEDYAAIAKIAHNPTNLLRLANFQMSRFEHKEAAQTYKAFFDGGGDDLDARYNYARVLGENGEIDQASKYFEEVLKSKPEILQITVIQNYVRLLMKANRKTRAMQLVSFVRKHS